MSGRRHYRVPERPAGRVVVVLGHGGPVVEAALRFVGPVRVHEAADREVWAASECDVEVKFPAGRSSSGGGVGQRV